MIPEHSPVEAIGHGDDELLHDLADLRSAVEADAVALVTPLAIAGECRTALRAWVGDPALLTALGPMHGAAQRFGDGAPPRCVGDLSPALPPVWMLLLPDDGFVMIEASWTPHGFPVLAVHPQAPLAPSLWRAHVNQSGHLDGLVVLARWGRSGPFSARAQRRADHSLTAVRALPAGAPSGARSMTLIYTRHGELVATSVGGGGALQAAEAAALRTHVRRFLRSGLPNTRSSSLVGALDLQRLSGPHGDRVIVSLTRPRLFQVQALRSLTTRQREIAAYVVSGSGIRQIGAGLNLSANTIKHHLKQIYARLEVSGHAQLRARLSAA